MNANSRTTLPAAAVIAMLLIAGALVVARFGVQAPETASNTITVFAAASLREAFTEIGAGFQQQSKHRVLFNFAGSQQLAEQIALAAPADVFASADQRQMTTAIRSGRIVSSTAVVFARNKLVVITPKANSAGVTTLQDLGRPGLKLVIAAPAVPAGQYAQDFLEKAAAQAAFGEGFARRVLANVVSYEQDVRGVFGKVALGEADAGIVYASDVVSNNAGAISRIEIPDALNTLAEYPIAPLQDSPNLQAADAFVQYVLSPAGQMALAKHGLIATGGDAPR